MHCDQAANAADLARQYDEVRVRPGQSLLLADLAVDLVAVLRASVLGDLVALGARAR